jgi:eukaryotic-like serine/threonine-protein kinase
MANVSPATTFDPIFGPGIHLWNSMSIPSTCSRCGRPLPTVTDGVCPRCELAAALEPAPPFAPPPDAAPDSALKHFGDYELLEELGHGGMGVVYRARHTRLNRIVALKLLLLGPFSSAAALRRFQREAQAAAALRHPNIVALHDIGEVGGQPYFTMEFVEGSNLATLLRAGPLPARRAAEYARAIADAMSAAHAAGIIHRDLKPFNIVLDPFDQPRVTDFGLAKFVVPPLGGSPAKEPVQAGTINDLTLTGQILGSPNYLAPELAGGRIHELSPASDLFSMGAMLYECLTGHPPFVAATLQETLFLLRDAEPVPPRILNPRLPRDLETICLKCLEKEPARRYASARDLADELGRFLKDEPIHARPVGRAGKVWRWCRRKPALASFVAATVLLLVAILIGSPIAVYRIQQARKAEQAQLKRTEEESLKARQFAYASDMNLAHQAVQEDDFYRALQLLDRHRPVQESEIRNLKSEMDLRGWEWRYLWRQCQGEERFILGEHTNGATAVGLLTDGKTVFSAGRDKCVRLWDLESRRQIGLLPHAEEIIGATASADGRWLATATEKGPVGQPVLLWDLSTQKIAATLPTNSFWQRPGSITFSPDSKWLAFATVFGGVRLWDVNARSEVTNLSASSISPVSLGLAFSPDSRTLAYNENEHGTILLWDIASRSLDRLTGHHDVVRSLAFSPDGRTLASGSRDRTARLWNLADPREEFRLTNHTSGSCSLAFSPDGRTLAMSLGGGLGQVIRLVEVATGSQISDLRGHLKEISSLTFTPDGQTLLSASDDGTLRVWGLAPRAKEKSAHSITPDLSADWSTYGPALCLSPDGRHLLAVHTNQTFSLWDTLRLTEGERHPLPFTNTTIAAVAPGGRLAAFANWRGEVRLWDVTTGQAQFFAQPVTNRIHRLVFSLDGRYLAAANDTKALSDTTAPILDPRRTIRMWDVGARRETHVLPTDGALPVSLTFSADAKALIAGSSIGSVKLWPLNAPGQAAKFHGHSVWVEGLALLPDGQTLISAGTDIRFWDVRTRHETDKLNARAGGFSSVALSPDSRRFAAGTSGGLILIWDLASHQEVATFSGHRQSVAHLAFTPDGDHLVSVSKDQLRVWRAASLAEAGTEKEARK